MPLLCHSQLPGNAKCDAVQPTSHRLTAPDRASFLSEDKKRRLESILGVVFMTQYAATNTKDERTVPAHKSGESGLIPPSNEPLQQDLIRNISRRTNFRGG